MNTGTNTVHVREAVQHAAESAASHSYYSIKEWEKRGKKKGREDAFKRVGGVLLVRLTGCGLAIRAKRTALISCKSAGACGVVSGSWEPASIVIG